MKQIHKIYNNNNNLSDLWLNISIVLNIYKTTIHNSLTNVLYMYNHRRLRLKLVVMYNKLILIILKSNTHLQALITFIMLYLQILFFLK